MRPPRSSCVLMRTTGTSRPSEGGVGTQDVAPSTRPSHKNPSASGHGAGFHVVCKARSGPPAEPQSCTGFAGCQFWVPIPTPTPWLCASCTWQPPSEPWCPCLAHGPVQVCSGLSEPLRARQPLTPPDSRPGQLGPLSDTSARAWPRGPKERPRYVSPHPQPGALSL